MPHYHYRPSFMLKQRPWLSALVAGIFFAEYSLSLAGVALAQTITADPNAGANRPTIDGSANGVPVINIVRPNDKGISHNKYQDLNIPTQGAILNNSGSATNTQLAGWIDKNNHYNPNDSARLILNEVTGPNISQLAGYLEVAGAKADIIIANPNGIHGAAFGFINTSRVTLTTGTPEFDTHGNLSTFAVRGGKVTLDGNPAAADPNLAINASNFDHFDILARAVQINAAVHAKKLNIVTGANRVKYDDLTTEKITPTPTNPDNPANPDDPAAETPLVALDIAALGGMYAGRIRLVGTEDGLGVNSRGNIAAGIDGFTLTTEGKVVLNGQTTSDATITINAKNGITNTGALHAADTATLNAGHGSAGVPPATDSSASIENTGLLASQKNILLTADGKIANTGVLAAGLDTSGNFTNPAATLAATAGAAITGSGQQYATTAINLTAAQLDLSGATTQAATVTLTALTGDILHRNAQLGATNLTITTPGTLDNTASQINATNLAIIAQNLLNDHGLIQQTGATTTHLQIASTFTNISGAITTNGDLVLNAATLDNTSGYIATLGAATLATTSGFNNTLGQILSYGDLRITNATGLLVNTTGTIQTASSLTLANTGAAGLDNTSGLIAATGPLAITTPDSALNNTAGTISSGSDLSISTAFAITSATGSMIAAGDITLAAASLDNTSGAIDAANALTIHLAPSPLAPHPLLDNTGGALIARTGPLALQAATLDNTRGAIATGSSLALALDGAFANNQGTLSAIADFSLTAASLSNLGGTLSSGAAMTLAATTGGITNTGEIFATGPLTINAAATLASTGTALIATNSALTLNAATLDNTGLINAGHDIAIAIAGAAANTNGGCIATNSALTLNAATLDNSAGAIFAVRDAAITLASTTGRLDNTLGLITANGALDLRTAAALDNTSGEISAAGSLALAASSLDNTLGLLSSGSAATITLAASLLNTGGAITAGDTLTLDIGGALSSAGASAIIGSNAALTITAASLKNTNSARITSARSSFFTIHTSFDNTSGAIASGSTLTLAAATLDNTRGLLTATGDLDITLSGGNTTRGLDNTAGTIIAGGNSEIHTPRSTFINTGGELTIMGRLRLDATTLDNTGAGSIYSGTDARITLTGALDNSARGSIQTGGALDLSLDGALDNTTGQILATRALSISNQQSRILNQSGLIGGNHNLTLTAATLDNTAGSITFNGDATLTLTGSLINTGDAHLLAGGKLTLAAALVDNALGIIKAADGIAATLTGAWDNTEGILVAGTGGLALSAATLANTAGSIMTTGPLAIALTGSLDNTRGQISSDTAATLAASAITNTAGRIKANDTLAITLASGPLDNTLGVISAGAPLTIRSPQSAIRNTSGIIVSDGIAITAATLDNTAAGYIGSSATLAITLTGPAGLDNSGKGEILANGDITITAATLDNSNSGASGGIYGNSNLSITTTAGSLNNAAGSITALGASTCAIQTGIANTAGYIASGSSLAITARNLDNTAGGAIVSGNPLSVTLTGALDNTAGHIATSGSAAITATRVTNDAGRIQASGDIDLRATQGALTNIDGVLTSARNLALSPASGIDNTGGHIQSAGNLAITNTGASAIDNTRGVITASTTLSIANTAAGFINTGGLVATGAAGDLSLNLKSLAPGAGGALIAGRNLSLTLATGDFTLDGTQEFWANGDIALTLSDGAFTNTGANLAACGLFTINAAKGITNTAGALLCAGGLNLVTTGTLLNLGRIDADYIHATADIIQNRSLIIGQVVSLDSRELHNTGAPALIASTQFLGLYTSGLLTNNRGAGVTGSTAPGATILTLGDLVIAGRGAGGTGDSPVFPTDITTLARAGRVENLSSTIEAGGNAMIAAATFENKKDTFATQMYLSGTEVFDRNNLDATNTFHVNKPGDGNRYYEGVSVFVGNSKDSTWLEYTKYTYNTRITQDSPEARLMVSGNLKMSVGAATNCISTIAVGGNLHYHDSGTVENINVPNTQLVVHGSNGYVAIWEKDPKTVTSWDGNHTVWEDKNIGTWYISDKDINIADPRFTARTAVGGAITGTIAELYNGTMNNRPTPATRANHDTSVSGPDIDPITGANTIDGHTATDNSAGTAGAGNTASIDDPSGNHDLTVADLDAPDARPPLAPPVGDGSMGHIPDGGKTTPTLTITAPGEVTFTTPQNPLYTINTDPAQPYLIVTDPRFTDWNNYISSDYFFQRISADPQLTHKRLGDGFYEQRLILDQITAVTGKRFLDDYTSDDEQYMALMDNALAQSTALNLSFGKALSPGQIAALTSDIVWMVEVIVNGHTVLAPVVYLCNATLAQIENGAVISARDIDLAILGDAVNNGTIRADRDMRLQAASILNDGGALKTGGAMTLVAKTDITNIAGSITAGGNATLTAGRDITSLAGAITTGGDATLVAGRDISLASVADVTNFGVATITTVRDQTLATGGNLLIQAGRDLTLTGIGATVGADAALIAGRDLTLDTVRSINTYDTTYSGGFTHIEQVTHTLTTLDIGGNLALRAGNFNITTPPVPSSSSLPLTSADSVGGLGTINLASAQLNAAGDISLAATGNINLTAVTDRDFSDIQNTTSGFMWTRTERTMHDDETVLGATLQSGGNITMSAGLSGMGDSPMNVAQAAEPAGLSGTGDSPVGGSAASGNITLQSAYLNAANTAALAATNDITLTTTGEHHASLYEKSESKLGFNSNAAQGVFVNNNASATHDKSTADLAIGTLISGNAVAMQAGNDINVHGSQVVATENIALNAARDINITAATNTYTEEHDTQNTKTGMISNNAFSLTFGKREQTTDLTQITTEAAGSLIGSTDGRVDLFAGRDATIIGSDLWSQNGLSIDAQNINILAAQNTTTTDYKQTTSQSGLTVQIKSSIIDAAMAVYSAADRGAQVKDERLQGLYAAKTAYAASDAYNSLSKTFGGATSTRDAAAKGAATIKLAVSVGASKSEFEQKTSDTEYIASNLSTAGDMFLNARGDGSTPGSGNINIIGSDLTAQNLALAAANDITIESSEATHSLRSENSNISANVGVAFGVSKNSAGLSFFADVSMGEGHENGDSTINTNSHLTAADTLTLTSGRDTTIAGAALAGDKVALDIGRDLNLISRQDTNTYDAAQQQISVSGEGGSGGGGGSLSYNRSDTEASYASVVEQTGIHAGAGGFDINVGNNTNLTGAVIASEAEAALNRLSTQTLTYGDIQNHSEYDSKSISINIAAGSGGASVSGGMSHQSDSETGATKSAIAAGDITVRSDYDANGNRIADSLAALSRDTATANDGSVDNIFDQGKIALQQEMAQVAGEVGFRAVGDLSKLAYEKQVKNLKEKYRVDDKTGAPQGMTQDEVDAYYTELAQINNTWNEGGIAKIALHTVVGAVQASLGGGDVLSGALGAGMAETARRIDVSEAILGDEKWERDEKGNIITATGEAKAIDQLFSTAIGLSVGAVAGDAMTGGGAAWSAEQYNRQLHDGKNGTKDEIGKLEDEAARLAADPALQEQYGIFGTEAEILAKLKLAAFEMVKYGDEISSDKLYHYATKEMQAIGEAGAKNEIAFLEQFQQEGFFTYDEKSAEVDKYAATGRFSNKYYETVGYDDFGRAIEILTSEGRALQEAYNKEKAGGYLDLVNGFTTAKPVISTIAQMAKDKLPWTSDSQILLPERVYDSGWREIAFGDSPGEVSKADYDNFIRWRVYKDFLPEESPKVLWGLITLTDYSASGAYLDTAASNYGLLEARALTAENQPALAFAARMQAMPQAGLELAAQNVDWVMAADGVVGLGQLIKAGGKTIGKQITKSVDDALKGISDVFATPIDSTVAHVQTVLKTGADDVVKIAAESAATTTGRAATTDAATIVFRVEGAPNTRIIIGENGQVAIQGDEMLFLNFGDKARAEEFLTKRLSQGMPDAQIKSFEVPQSFLDELKAAAVPESMAKQFPNSPLIVDPTKAANQFGLRPEQIELLKKTINQGTGKAGGGGQ